MKDCIQSYMSDFEKHLNVDIMDKSYDRPLVEYIIDCWKSLEIVRNIKILRWEYNESEDQDINKHVRLRGKKNKDIRIKQIKDTRYNELTVWVEVTVREPLDGEIVEHQSIIKKTMMIPTFDENGYLMIKGKRYFLLYQLLDKSTYITAQCVILKSLMPVTVKRNKVTIEDMDGAVYDVPQYDVFIFKNEVNVIIPYAATRGMSSALNFLGVSECVELVKEVVDDENHIHFQISSKLFLKVEKSMFDKYQYIQAIVAMIMTMKNNRFTLESINDKNYWIKKLGNNNYDKGINILIFFNRLLDETTRKILRLDPYHKRDIYTILRWLMQNFNELRLKDNLSLDNKRIRCNEYIASLLTIEFSKRLNRIISQGSKAGLAEFKDLFKIPGDILIQKMHSSGILRTEEVVNDLDFFQRFKWTKKGPHALGGKNERTISIKQRGIDPSFIGKVDMTVCSNSDPGTSGMLSPFVELNSMYFDSDSEPDCFTFEYKKDIEKIMARDDVQYISIDFKHPDDYYKFMNEMEEWNERNVIVKGVSKDDGDIKVIVENVDDKDVECADSGDTVDI